MVVKYSLFLYQHLLPICDVNNSSIVDDPKQNSFSDVETFSACYAFDIGLLGSYVENYKVPTIDELVNFDGVVIRDRLRGGSDSALYSRWKYNSSYYDK